MDFAVLKQRVGGDAIEKGPIIDVADDSDMSSSRRLFDNRDKSNLAVGPLKDINSEIVNQGLVQAHCIVFDELLKAHLAQLPTSKVGQEVGEEIKGQARLFSVAISESLGSHVVFCPSSLPITI